LAGRQFNRVSYAQLRSLGLSRRGIEHRIATGSLTPAETGVYAVAPLLTDDDWGNWMGATLTAPGSVLSHASAAAAWGFWTLPRHFEIVTRPGSGGPVRHGGVLAFRSERLEGECDVLEGVPITAAPRTLLDLAAHVTGRGLARAVREAIRTKRTSLLEIGDALGRHRGRRGAGRLGLTVARYSGLPLERARSGAEVRALEILRAAEMPMPQLNARIAGEEADLSWARWRLIIEVDGGPFHLDVGEDARKQALWEGAGWTVRRIDADDIYAHPHLLVRLAQP
jgi:hypothetical protein